MAPKLLSPILLACALVPAACEYSNRDGHERNEGITAKAIVDQIEQSGKNDQWRTNGIKNTQVKSAPAKNTQAAKPLPGCTPKALKCKCGCSDGRTGITCNCH